MTMIKRPEITPVDVLADLSMVSNWPDSFATEAERAAYRKGFEDGRWDVVSVLEDVVQRIVWETKAKANT